VKKINEGGTNYVFLTSQRHFGALKDGKTEKQKKEFKNLRMEIWKSGNRLFAMQKGANRDVKGGFHGAKRG
jgi:hypothetical protein